MSSKWNWMIFAVFFSWGCSTISSWQGWSVQKNIIYKQVGDVHLSGDLYSPNGGESLPAVIVVHGGGWSRRSGDMEAVSKRLAKAGFVVFNMTYRLAPQNQYPRAVEDVRDAIHWLRANAKKYRIHPDHISGWGYSAGAHLILLAGLEPSTGLKAIVSGGTPADLTVWPNSPLVLKLLGVPLSEKPDVWKAASPVNHVTDHSPPVFLYHGQWDKIVEHEQMLKMEAALKAKQRPVETHTVSFMGHLAVYFLSQHSVDLGIDFLRRKTRQGL